MLSGCESKNVFRKLQPEQRLVIILFVEVELTQVICFIGDYVLGHTNNVRDDSEINSQGVYDKFSGLDKLYFECLGRYVYCV